MGRLLIILGTALIIAAVALIIMVFSVEDIPIVQETLAGLYCEPNEIITHASVLRFGGTENADDLYFCDNNEGEEREITGQIMLTAGGVFIVPFLLGLLMTMYGAWSTQKNFSNKALSVTGHEIYKMKGGSLSQPVDFSKNTSNLADRLQQLDEARQQGLISKAEYDRTRQSILDSMDDNL